MTLLQNHGLIVAGDEEAAIVERSEAVVAAVRERIATHHPHGRHGGAGIPGGGRAPLARRG